MIGIGIIGAGSFATNHAKAIAEISGCKLVAASRRSSGELDQFTRLHNITGYSDYKDLLNDPNVDAVIVATPHQTHARISMDAAAAGKHILLEKPMATNLEDCDRIIQSAHASGVTLMIGHTMQFMRSSRVGKNIVDSGELGQIIYGTGHVAKAWMTPNRRDWHLNDPIGGGMLLTVGIHYIDLLTWLYGSKVSSVRANLSTLIHDQKADDAGMVFLQYENGATAAVTSTGFETGADSFNAILTCQKGMLKIDMFGGVYLGKDGYWQHLPESLAENTEHEALTMEWNAFISAINEGTQAMVTGEYGRHIMEICLAARESSQKKGEVWI